MGHYAEEFVFKIFCLFDGSDILMDDLLLVADAVSLNDETRARIQSLIAATPN